MEASEKQELLASLHAGRQALLEVLEGISQEEAARVPEPGRWSVLDCVEHVALVEDYLYARLLEGQRVEETGINPVRERRIRERAADRSRRVAAPDAVKPAGRYATLESALAEFLAARDRTIRYVDRCDEDLRARLTTHPLLGPANCHEMLLMIALHPLRHAAQIREVRTTS
jgi:uncharacterized damage-inducible protein DinB